MERMCLEIDMLVSLNGQCKQNTFLHKEWFFGQKVCEIVHIDGLSPYHTIAYVHENVWS